MQDWTPEDLQAWRARLGLTQAQAAERLGISLRAYSDRETGKSTITRECSLACMMIESLEQGEPTPDQRDTAAALQKLDGRLRGHQIMFESFVVAMMRERQTSKVPDWTMEIAMQNLNRQTSDDDPYMRGHVYEAVTEGINSLRLALQR